MHQQDPQQTVGSYSHSCSQVLVERQAVSEICLEGICYVLNSQLIFLNGSP